MTTPIDEAAAAKLRDPAYFALHLQAIAALREVGHFGWYDSNFLRRFEAAKAYLAVVRPEVLDAFVAAFEPLHPAPTFREIHVRDVFDDATRARIAQISRSATNDAGVKDACEREEFGRQVLWDHPYFEQLQCDLLPRMADLTGQALEPGYSFLSLYGAQGKCDPHLDEPVSMYTLDYCIDQSGVWPIHFSKAIDWPTRDTARDWDAEALARDRSLEFKAAMLEPNDAVLFSGSSQWHYRDPIAPGGFCHLLFFHYYPAGCRDLVIPSRWPGHFDIPELGPLCDLFAGPGTDGLG